MDFGLSRFSLSILTRWTSFKTAHLPLRRSRAIEKALRTTAGPLLLLASCEKYLLHVRKMGCSVPHGWLHHVIRSFASSARSRRCPLLLFNIFVPSSYLSSGTVQPPKSMPPKSRSALTITHRPSSTRGHFDKGWLRTFHSFSFDSYRDNAFPSFGPLAVINEDRVQASRGFGEHSHADFEVRLWSGETRCPLSSWRGRTNGKLTGVQWA